jgi:hypothetical protein
MEQAEFKDFGKIARFRTARAIVTEKIDGTNAQVLVPVDPAAPVLAGSRNRWVTPESDNFGFAAFVAEHAAVLRRLGPGRHFGEWYGAGIGRRYGLTERRLALFNWSRYSNAALPEGLPPSVEVVPVLYDGPLDTAAISAAIERLYTTGSVLVPGWSKPEGAVVQVGDFRWKVTDNGDQHKGCATDHRQVVKDAAAAERTKREAALSPIEDQMRRIEVRHDGRGEFTLVGTGRSGLEYGRTCAQHEIGRARRELAIEILDANTVSLAGASECPA